MGGDSSSGVSSDVENSVMVAGGCGKEAANSVSAKNLIRTFLCLYDPPVT